MKPDDINPTIRDNVMKRWWDRKGILPKGSVDSDEARVMFGFLAGIEFARRRLDETIFNIK